MAGVGCHSDWAAMCATTQQVVQGHPRLRAVRAQLAGRAGQPHVCCVVLLCQGLEHGPACHLPAGQARAMQKGCAVVTVVLSSRSLSFFS